MKKILFFVLILLFFGHLAYRIYGYGQEYTTPFDSAYWEYRYLHSQWVVSNSRQSIGDDGLYAYAGWKYITGINPVLLNPEIPPLGKYLIGLSIITFHNQNIFALIVGLFVLFVFYALNKALFKNSLLSFLPVVFFSLEPLYWEQLRAPYLDLLHLLFLMLTLLFVLKKKYFWSTFFLACMAGTKFSTLVVFLVGAIFIYLAFQKNKEHIKKYALSLPLAAIVFPFFYMRFFLIGNSFLDFLRVQKFIVNFYAVGAKAVVGAIFPMFITGNWYTWFDGVQRVTEWTILWPVLFVLSIGAFLYLFKDRKSQFVLIGAWILLYCIFLVFVPVTPRYLLLLLPFMYNLGVWVLSKSMPQKLLSYLS